MITFITNGKEFFHVMRTVTSWNGIKKEKKNRFIRSFLERNRYDVSRLRVRWKIYCGFIAKWIDFQVERFLSNQPKKLNNLYSVKRTMRKGNQRKLRKLNNLYDINDFTLAKKLRLVLQISDTQSIVSAYACTIGRLL